MSFFILKDKFSSQPPSKKLGFAIDGGYFKDPQLIKLKRMSNFEVLSPKWYIYNIKPPPRLRKQHEPQVERQREQVLGYQL